MQTTDLLDPMLDRRPDTSWHVDESPALRLVGLDLETDDWTDLGPDDLEAVDDEEHFSIEDAPELLLDAVDRQTVVESLRARLPRIRRRH